MPRQSRYIQRQESYLDNKKTPVDKAKEVLQNTRPECRDNHELRLLCQGFRKLHFFQHFSEHLIKTISQFVTLLVIEPGQCVFKQGDEGTDFYIVLEGKVELFVHVEVDKLTRETVRAATGGVGGHSTKVSTPSMLDDNIDPTSGKPVGVMEVGQAFGERASVALADGETVGTRAGTCRCADRTYLLKMTGEQYTTHAAGIIKREHAERIHFMADTAIYTALMWTDENLEEMLSWMWPKRYGVGTALVQEGHVCDKIYLLIRGEAASMINSGIGAESRYGDTESDGHVTSNAIVGTQSSSSTTMPHPLVHSGQAGVKRLGPGSWIGEEAASDPTEHSCQTVVTTSPVEVLELPRLVILKKMPAHLQRDLARFARVQTKKTLHSLVSARVSDIRRQQMRRLKHRSQAYMVRKRNVGRGREDKPKPMQFGTRDYSMSSRSSTQLRSLKSLEILQSPTYSSPSSSPNFGRSSRSSFSSSSSPFEGGGRRGSYDVTKIKTLSVETGMAGLFEMGITPKDEDEDGDGEDETLPPVESSRTDENERGSGSSRSKPGKRGGGRRLELTQTTNSNMAQQQQSPHPRRQRQPDRGKTLPRKLNSKSPQRLVRGGPNSVSLPSLRN